MRTWKAWGCLLGLIAGTGCTAPEPEPIDAEKSEREFRAHSFKDPGLLRFLQENPGARSVADPPGPWDLNTLTLVAFYYHPDLDWARARLAQTGASKITAEMWPNPVIGGEFAKVMKVEPGLTPWIYGLNLSFPLDSLWKRGYKIDEARYQQSGALLALAEAGWKVRSRVRAALAEYLFAIREQGLRKQEEAARADVMAAQERKLALGDVFRVEVDVAEGELHTARQAIHTSEGHVAESRVALAGALGLPGWAVQGEEFGWADLESPPAPEVLGLETAQKPGLLSRLDLQELLAEYAAAEEGLKREVASRYPDLSLAPGYLYDQGQRKLTLGLSITLPLLNQNEGPIAEADAKRKEIAAHFRALQASAIGEWESALERYRAARAELAESRKTLELLTKREAAVRRAIELRDLDRTALTGLHLEQVQAEESRVGALRHAEEALGALEDALQHPLGGRAGTPAVDAGGSRESR